MTPIKRREGLERFRVPAVGTHQAERLARGKKRQPHGVRAGERRLGKALETHVRRRGHDARRRAKKKGRAETKVANRVDETTKSDVNF